MIDVKVLDVQPHSDQATTHPNYWKVKIRVTYRGTPHTFWRWHKFWRWHNMQEDRKPEPDEIVERFWDDTFTELRGFDFEYERDA